jgi:hypothetical protein
MNGLETFMIAAAAAAAISSVCAAIAAVLGPYRVSRMLVAQQTHFRIERSLNEEKIRIFHTLMAHRLNFTHPDAIAAMNLIDVVWVDTPAVREKWDAFHRTLDNYRFTRQQIDHQYFELLRAIAHDLGLSTKLKNVDFGRAYYAEAPRTETSRRNGADERRQPIDPTQDNMHHPAGKILVQERAVAAR